MLNIKEDVWEREYDNIKSRELASDLNDCGN